MDKDLLVWRELCPKNHLFFSNVRTYLFLYFWCWFLHFFGQGYYAFRSKDTQWVEKNSILRSPLLWRLGLG
jgi:hypothetical protein